jgi:hypothetical protein
MVLMRRNNQLATPNQEIQNQDLWILGDFSDVTTTKQKVVKRQKKGGRRTQRGRRPPSPPQELAVRCALGP